MTPEERAAHIALEGDWIDDAVADSPAIRYGALRQLIAAAIRDAVKAERERCERLCEETIDSVNQEIADDRALLGKNYDNNCFGSGWNAGARDAASELLDAIKRRDA